MKAMKRSLRRAGDRRRVRRRRGAGADFRQRDQDRRAVGHVEPLHRPGRRGLGRARHGWPSRTRASRSAAYKVEIVSADHQNKPDVGSGDRAPVVRRRQGRRHRRRAQFRRRARRQPDHQGQGQGVPRVRPGIVGSDRQGVLAQHGALDLRHVDAGQRHRQRDRQVGRRHVVLPHRRLRVRPCARARHRGRRAEERRQGPGQGAGAAQHAGLLARSCCRRRRRRRRSSASPTPAATRPTRSSRRPSSASSRAARTWPGCSCSSPTSTRSDCRPRRA